MKKSWAWPLISTSLIALVLLVITGMSLMSDHSVESTNPVPIGVMASFALAALALGTAVGANASAFLNEASSFTSRIVGPMVLALVLVIVMPYFISLGLTIVQ